jgi:brassinosteroid-6-oxidase 1
LQGRKKAIKIIRELIENRRASSKTHDDMLDSLLANADPRYDLNDEERDDQIIMLLNSGYETISTTTMMAIKYLHDHPEALQELRVKQHFSLLFNFIFLHLSNKFLLNTNILPTYVKFFF